MSTLYLPTYADGTQKILSLRPLVFSLDVVVGVRRASRATETVSRTKHATAVVMYVLIPPFR